MGAVIDPLQPGVGVDERKLRRTAHQRGVPLVPARRGMTYRLGRLRVQVLWPDHAGSPDEDPHVHGTVLLASYGSVDLLLTGDSESAVTRSLPLRQVEVLKVAHHGSSDAGLAAESRNPATPGRDHLGRRPQRLRASSSGHARRSARTAWAGGVPHGRSGSDRARVRRAPPDRPNGASSTVSG